MDINITSFTPFRDEINKWIVAKNKVKESDSIDISGAILKSKEILGDYVTLNNKLIFNIDSIFTKITEYYKDKNLNRPLNILLNASPGSGKSYLVKNLAKKLSSFKILLDSINMVELTNLDEFQEHIYKTIGIDSSPKNIMLFIDEFDSSIENLKMLLPLMWEGEFRYNGMNFKRRRMVIILAGSSPDIESLKRLAKTMDDSIIPINSSENKYGSKLVDLLSRVNGGAYKIPKYDYLKNTSVDQVCIAVAILKKRFKGLNQIPWALLKFVSSIKFRYNIRSINTFLYLISKKSYKNKKIELSKIDLPLLNPTDLHNSVLSYHIIADEAPHEILSIWDKYRRYNNLVTV